MDDLSKFLNFLYEDQKGYIYVASKGEINPATSKPDWKQEFFSWPSSQQEIEDYIKTNSLEKDVYLAPAIFKGKQALKSRVKGSNVVWVEFDGQEQIDFDSLGIPQPDCIIQSSSPTHLHCYWKIPFSTTDVVEGINRRLTYYLEADSSGWDANQVLRPPSSKNWKHGGIPVLLRSFNPATEKFDFSSFDSAPSVERDVINLQEQHLENPETLLKNIDISPQLRKKIVDGTVPVGSRSSFMTKIGHELAEEGCNHTQIVSLLYYVDDRIHKFTGRNDRIKRLSEIASLVLLDKEISETISLLSPLDILSHEDNLEWLLEGWVHHSGFCIVTGAPGVGKTTFGLQLLYHFATAQNFLNKTVSKEMKCLFISLEMSFVELKYIIGHHQKGFEQIDTWNNNLLVMDQDSLLSEYEAIISDVRPQVILIDSLSELAQDELKEAESKAITRWIRKIRRRYNCAVIAIHHNRKESSGTQKRVTKLSDVYGSFIFGKDADTVINLEADPDEPNYVGLATLKARFAAKSEMMLVRDENLIFTEGGRSDSPNTGTDGSAKANFSLD